MTKRVKKVQSREAGSLFPHQGSQSGWGLPLWLEQHREGIVGEGARREWLTFSKCWAV